MSALRSVPFARPVGWVLGALVAVQVTLGVGSLVPDRPVVALGVAGAVLSLGVVAADATIIPLLMMPLFLVVARFGGGSVDLSVSDAALALATLTVLVFGPRPFSPPVRTLLWLSAIYQFATLFSVVANPHLAGVVEWIHTWMLIAGALLVGWTVGRSGHARSGLTLLLVTTLALALITIAQGVLQYAQGDFGPVYLTWPYNMHKNFTGTVLGFATIVAYARPPWMGWRKGWAFTAFGVMMTALVMTQSRQALVGVAAALVVIALRGDPHRRRSKLIVFLMIPAALVVVMTVRDQIQSADIHNSTFTRLDWFQETLAYWSTSPWVGHGLRYWYQPGQPTFQPPNAELEVLATTGIVGLVAFLLFALGGLKVLWWLEPTYGTPAVAMFLGRLVQGQLDQFWSAVQASVPMIVIGICLGALARWEAGSEAGRRLPAVRGAAFARVTPEGDIV